MTSDAGQPGTPRFNVVLRGYDRRQVDEHVARLQRVIARMRADLSSRSQFPDGPGHPQRQGHPQGWSGPGQGPGQGFPPGESPDAIAGFTDRMQRILQSAEEEAEEIRNKARMAARAEGEQVRAQLDELARQRDGMLRELAQLQGHLHEQAPDHTTRMPRPMPGEPQRGGGMPSPRPRPPTPPAMSQAPGSQSPAAQSPAAQPPMSSPSMGQGKGPRAQVPGAHPPGVPQVGQPAAPPPEPPRTNMGRRLDLPPIPPLWEMTTSRASGPIGDGAGRPGTDSRPATPPGESPEPPADHTELRPVPPVVGAEAAAAADGSRPDPESTDQLVGGPGGAAPARSQNGVVPFVGRGSTSSSDEDAESRDQVAGSERDGETPHDTPGRPDGAESDVEPGSTTSDVADRAADADSAGSDVADPDAADDDAADDDAATSRSAPAAEWDAETTMVVQAVRSSPLMRSSPEPGKDQGRKPGDGSTDPDGDTAARDRPSSSTSRSG